MWTFRCVLSFFAADVCGSLRTLIYLHNRSKCLAAGKTAARMSVIMPNRRNHRCIPSYLMKRAAAARP
nr:MAG TPA: hypothetical protein [Caudoviricetes sp.]